MRGKREKGDGLLLSACALVLIEQLYVQEVTDRASFFPFPVSLLLLLCTVVSLCWDKGIEALKMSQPTPNNKICNFTSYIGLYGPE